MPLDLTHMLLCMEATSGPGPVVDAVYGALDRRRRRDDPEKSREEYLDQHGLRHLLITAVNRTKRKINDHKKLDQFIRRSRIPVEWLFNADTRFAPWDELIRKCHATVVIGGKHAPAEEGKLQQTTAGVHDLQAVADLLLFLREDAELDYQPEMQLIPPDATRKKADEMARELLKKNEGGILFVLGSPTVNPVTDPIARLMFPDLEPEELPARFRWGFSQSDPQPFLSETRVYRDDEGIVFRRNGKTNLPRMRDEKILERLARTGRRGTFPDCGLLIINAQMDPVTVICAGHGGCGTIAAVQALSQLETIELRLNGDDVVDPGLLYEAIEVKRKKPTTLPIDDLTYPRAYGTGWKLVWV